MKKALMWIFIFSLISFCLFLGGYFIIDLLLSLSILNPENYALIRNVLFYAVWISFMVTLVLFYMYYKTNNFFK